MHDELVSCSAGLVQRVFGLHGADRRLEDLLFFLRSDSFLHGDDLAVEGGELLVARGHARRSPTQKRLQDELEDLDFSFGEAVADPHKKRSTSWRLR